MSATSVERVSNPTHFAELQLTGIKPATLVTGPVNSTTELRPEANYHSLIEVIFNKGD